jgi:hypothetical protein
VNCVFVCDIYAISKRTGGFNRFCNALRMNIQKGDSGAVLLKQINTGAAYAHATAGDKYFLVSEK